MPPARRRGSGPRLNDPNSDIKAEATPGLRRRPEGKDHRLGPCYFCLVGFPGTGGPDEHLRFTFNKFRPMLEWLGALSRIGSFLPSWLRFGDATWRACGLKDEFLGGRNDLSA